MGAQSPAGTARTTASCTSTYTVSSTPSAATVHVLSVVQPSERQQQQQQNMLLYGFVDGRKKLVDDICAELTEDPVTKEVVEKRLISFVFRDPQGRQASNGATTSGSSYTFYVNSEP